MCKKHVIHDVHVQQSECGSHGMDDNLCAYLTTFLGAHVCESLIAHVAAGGSGCRLLNATGLTPTAQPSTTAVCSVALSPYATLNTCTALPFLSLFGKAI